MLAADANTRRLEAGACTTRCCRQGGWMVTGASAFQTASTSPGNSRSRCPHDKTPQSSQQLLNVASLSGPDLRFSRQCRVISRFYCRAAGLGPRRTQSLDSSAGRSSGSPTSAHTLLLTEQHSSSTFSPDTLYSFAHPVYKVESNLSVSQPARYAQHT